MSARGRDRTQVAHRRAMGVICVCDPTESGTGFATTACCRAFSLFCAGVVKGCKQRAGTAGCVRASYVDRSIAHTIQYIQYTVPSREYARKPADAIGTVYEL